MKPRMYTRIALSAATPWTSVRAAGSRGSIVGMHQEKARGQYLTGFLALTLRALWFKPVLLLFEGGTYLKNGLALFALIVIKRHRHTP